MSASGARVRLPGEIWILVAAAFVVAIGFGIASPALPAYARAFDVGYTAVSAVVSLFAGFRLAFAPVGGMLVSRFGERRIYLIGLLVSAASATLTGFAQTYWQLLLFRGIGGIGSTAFTVGAFSLLVRLAPPAARGRAAGMWGTGFLLGNISGPILGGLLLGVDLSAPFLVYGAALVGAVLVSLPLLRRRSEPGSVAGEPELPELTFRMAVRHPAYRAALLAGFANGWTSFGVRIVLVPLYIIEVLQQSETWLGYALAVFAAGNAATLALSGRIADRRGRKPPMLTGLLVTGIATGVLGLVAQPWLFLVLSLVAGLGSGIVNPPMTATVADVIGNRARGGTVLAGFQMSADLGSIAGPLLTGIVAEVAGFGWAFVLTGVVSLAALALWSTTPETLPRPVREEPAAPRGAERPTGLE